MDHSEAIRRQVVEKYVLGELSQDVRDAFEEHYFDCGECALDVKAAAAFVDAGRQVLRTATVEAGAESTGNAQGKRGWLFWLRPVVAVPVFAALLIVVAYQNTVTIPQAKQEAARGAGQLFTSSFSFPKTGTRGGALRAGEGTSGEEASAKVELKVQVHPNESFGLKFDFTPAKTFNSYLCELQDESGRPLVREVVAGTSINQEAELAVRGGLVKPGQYNLVVLGSPGEDGQKAREEVLRLGFSVEFLP